MRQAPDSPPQETRWWLHALLFLATCATTFFAGGFYGQLDGSFSVISGIMFSACIMGILLVHEMGHFTASRLHGVNASLPYFIPFLPPIGTMGAFIHMKGPPRTRSSMLDIGYAGPLAGLVVTIVVCFIGLRLSEVIPLSDLPSGSSWMEGNSLLYLALKKLAHPEMGPGDDVFMHPVAWAGWLGIMVTSLNLIPAGQLDGGHVVYGLFGQKIHFRLARLVQPLLFAMGLAGAICLVAIHHGPTVGTLREMGILGIVSRVSGMTFWLVWVILLKYVGGKHPPVEDPSEPLSTGRKVVGFITMLVFVTTFTPVFLSLVIR